MTKAAKWCQDNPEELATITTTSPKKKESMQVKVMISWTEFSGSRKKKTWEGEAIIKGDWIMFDDRKRKVDGNWINVEILD